MSRKTLIWVGLTIGSAIGGYLPVLWGGDVISFSSVVLSAAGGIVGIWLGYRFGEYESQERHQTARRRQGSR